MLDTGDYERGINKALGHTESLASKMGSGLKKIGQVAATALGAATTAVGAFVKSAVDVGAEFDATMSEVSAISGATGTEFDALREKALEMGATTKFSANEAAEAFTYMAMAGWKSGDMIDGISGIMDLAAASGENLALTSDIVTDALTAFGMSAADSGHFADVLAAASSNANTNVAMLGDSFRYVAPIAGTLGYSAEDTAVALGLMANSGIKASQAGTSLRAALSSMLDATDPTWAAMKQIGLATDDTVVAMVNADGTTKSLAETMDILRDAFANLTEAEQAEYAAQIFGREAMSGMLAIITATEEDYQKLTDAIYEADGAARQMAETMQDNLAGDMEEFGGALETLKIIISDGVTPTLREFVQFGTDAIETLSTAFQDGGLHGVMDALGTVLSEGLSMVITKLPDMVDAGMQLLGALGQGLLDNLDVILDAAESILLQLVDGLIIALPALADGALQIILSLGEKLAEALPDLVPAIVDLMTELVGMLVENIPDMFGVALEIIAGLAVGLIQAIPNLIAAIPEIVTSLIDGFMSLFGLNSPPSEFEVIGGDLIAGLLEGISAAWQAITDFFTGAVEGLLSLLGQGWETISQAASAAWDAIKAVLEDAWAAITAVWDQAVGFFTGVWEGVSGVFSGVSDFFNGVFSEAWSAVTSVWDKAVEFFTGVGDGIRSTFENVTAALSEFFTGAWEAVKGIWDEAVGFFSGVWEGISGAFAGAADFFGGVFSEAWEAVSSAWSGVKDFFSERWDDITGVFSGIGDWFKNIGSNIVDGLKTGIRNGWESFTGWLGGKVNGLVDAVMSMLGINSPSKVFASIGGSMAEGLGVGWEKEYDSIKSRIEDGMAFEPARIDVEGSALYTVSQQSGETAGSAAGRGGDTFNFYSPKALDPVSAARELKKAKQQMALGYV